MRFNPQRFFAVIGALVVYVACVEAVRYAKRGIDSAIATRELNAENYRMLRELVNRPACSCVSELQEANNKNDG